jgi:RHS repeat-associated protein
LQQLIRLPGQHYDEETGLYYNRHRYYDPRQGRYITQDPIGLDGGWNAYVYPLDPLSGTDPLGLDLTPAQKNSIKTAAEDWVNSNVPYVYGGTTKSGAGDITSGGQCGMGKEVGTEVYVNGKCQELF